MDATNSPAPKQFMASDIFPVPFKYPLNGFDTPWDTPTLKTPKRLQSYIWTQALINTMVLFWFSGETSLKLIGHTGTGKTEAVMQFHSALNLPLIMLTANPQMASRDLIGGFFPTASGYAWRDGPVTMAARMGLSVVIDEYNVLDPGEATGLNAFLEGRAFTIPETGETVVPRQGFRVFATINPKASGYNGRQTQDLANDDRFVDAHTVYPPKDVEIAAISEYLKSASTDPAEAANIAEAVATGASAIRQAYMGENDDANALPCTMSMRCSMRMAKWTVLYTRVYQGGAPESPLYMALDTVLANRQRPEVRKAVREAFKLATGIDSEVQTS
jgi:cobaltochelatase CobS